MIDPVVPSGAGYPHARTRTVTPDTHGMLDAWLLLNQQQTSHATVSRNNGGYSMKTLELQLITVGLEDGQQGVFVGLPLLLGYANNDCSQIENIWFSAQCRESFTLRSPVHQTSELRGSTPAGRRHATTRG